MATAPSWELDDARGLQSPPKESSDSSSSSDSKGSNNPDDKDEAPREEEEKGSPNGNPDVGSPVPDNIFDGDSSNEGQKPPVRKIKPLHEGRGADHKTSYEEYEEALNRPTAHMLKEPPATACVAHALKATGNKRAQTPGRTPRVQPPPPANPPSVARRTPVMLLDHEEQQVLDNDSGDSKDDTQTRQLGRDLCEVVGLPGSAVTILLDDGLTSPLRLYQTAKPELDKLFKANPEFGARDRTRLNCYRTLLLNVLPSDLKEREGIPTKELLEEALNRQAKQAQAVAVAKSTPRREAPLEPPRDDRPTARQPDMYDGDPKKWPEFKNSFTVYMMSQSLQYKHVLDQDEKRYDFAARTGPGADDEAQDTHDDFKRYQCNYEVRTIRFLIS